GGALTVALRLESGEELPFAVDTGAPITVFDKSLEPKLGKRLGTMPIIWASGDKQKSGIYATPKLYLGGVPLKPASYVFPCRIKPGIYATPKRPLNVLGMDCLRHYCLQLDFEAGKMRF